LMNFRPTRVTKLCQHVAWHASGFTIANYIYMYICIYIVIVTSIYIYLHTYIYIYIHIPYTYIYIYIHIYIYVCLYIYIYTYIIARHGSAWHASGCTTASYTYICVYIYIYIRSSAVFESLCVQGAVAQQPTIAMVSDTMTAIPAMTILGSDNFGIFKASDFMHWSKYSSGFQTKEPKDHGTQT
jgi:hypothetical protein